MFYHKKSYQQTSRTESMLSINMKLTLLLMLVGLTSRSLGQIQNSEYRRTNDESVDSISESDLNTLIESTLGRREDVTEGRENITDAETKETTSDLEQFLLHSEQLLKEEHDKLETLTVRSGSHEEEMESLRVKINHQQDQISQLLRRDAVLEKELNALKGSAGIKTQQQLTSGDEESLKVGTLSPADFSGVSYVRWGRTECEGSAQVVYKGSAAGANYLQQGGGSDFLCVPESPEWGNILGGRQSWRNYIYGVEYEVDFPGYPFSTRNNNGQNLHDNDAPCAVCHVPTRSSQLMIPAKMNCPVGWVKEYNGYLMTSHHTRHRSSYVCVDGAPETVPGGQADLNGALWYPVEGGCGSLPCPKYVDGWEISCVVCTK